MDSKEKKHIKIIQELFHKNEIEISDALYHPDYCDRYAFNVIYDDVRYLIEVMKPRGTEKFNHQIKEKTDKFKLLIQRHHHRIKNIYLQIKEKFNQDIWVMSGGGAQLQAFFGDKNGYIAILYLDLMEEEDNSDFALLMERKSCDEVLLDLDVEDIEIVSYKEMWGDTEY